MNTIIIKIVKYIKSKNFIYKKIFIFVILSFSKKIIVFSKKKYIFNNTIVLRKCIRWDIFKYIINIITSEIYVENNSIISITC